MGIYLNRHNVIQLNMQNFLSRSHNIEKMTELISRRVLKDLCRGLFCIYGAYGRRSPESLQGASGGL